MKLKVSEQSERKIWKARINVISSQNGIGFHGAIQSFLSIHITNPTSIQITGMPKTQREIFWFFPLFCSHFFHPFALYSSYCLGSLLPTIYSAVWTFLKKNMFLRKVVKNKTKFGMIRQRSLTLHSASKSVLWKSVFKDHGNEPLTIFFHFILRFWYHVFTWSWVSPNDWAKSSLGDKTDIEMSSWRRRGAQMPGAAAVLRKDHTKVGNPCEFRMYRHTLTEEARILRCLQALYFLLSDHCTNEQAWKLQKFACPLWNTRLLYSHCWHSTSAHKAGSYWYSASLKNRSMGSEANT